MHFLSRKQKEIMLDVIQYLNGDKLFYMFAMLSTNVGSRYVIQDLSKMQERALASPVAKRIVLFCMVFVATRDVVMSAIVTFVLVFLVQYLFNENSAFCIIPDVISDPLSGNTLVDLSTSIKRK